VLSPVIEAIFAAICSMLHRLLLFVLFLTSAQAQSLHIRSKPGLYIATYTATSPAMWTSFAGGPIEFTPTSSQDDTSSAADIVDSDTHAIHICSFGISCRIAPLGNPHRRIATCFPAT
jgi:hypothetical protein